MKNIEDAALTARKSLKDVFNVNLVYPISPKLLDKIVSQFGIVLKKDAECVYYLRKSKHGNAVIYYDDETKADFLYAVIVLFGCVLFDFKNMRKGEIRVYGDSESISDDALHFARAFLMPESDFKNDVRHMGNNVDALVEKYGVPQVIVKKRCMDLGVIL